MRFKITTENGTASNTFFFWHALLEPKIQQQRVSWTFFCCTSKVLAANLPMLVVHWTLSHAGAGVPEEVGPEEPHPKGWE
jgi:hypothetical protein